MNLSKYLRIKIKYSQENFLDINLSYKPQISQHPIAFRYKESSEIFLSFYMFRRSQTIFLSFSHV